MTSSISDKPSNIIGSEPPLLGLWWSRILVSILMSPQLDDSVRQSLFPDAAAPTLREATVILSRYDVLVIVRESRCFICVIICT